MLFCQKLSINYKVSLENKLVDSYENVKNSFINVILDFF